MRPNADRISAVVFLLVVAAFPAAAHEQKGTTLTFDRMAYYDLDGDGRVSRDEFWRSSPGFSGPVFIFADLDNDGYLNRRELDRAERRIRRNEGGKRRWVR